MRFHFIGVGGAGMSAVAHLCAARGVAVSGSDRGESAYFRALKDAGMDVRVGHDPALVEGADVVVVSTAIRETNPELARARDLGIDVWHRSEALRWALDDQRIVAVAGSHGKTTTSAMVAHLLHRAGIDASFAVGARVFGVQGAVAGGYAGTAGIAVVEADESDGSFLRFRPEVSILLNVEPDHLDFHGSVEALHEAFRTLARQSTTVLACADDPVALSLAHDVAEQTNVVTYGHGAQVAVTPDGVSTPDGDYTMQVPIPGAHNRLNAVAAWAAAVAVGADPGKAAEAMATFGGTGRRFQLRGEVGGVRVIDDYAHHPTEVAAVLNAAREAGAGHLVVLFQPALYTRTQLHWRAFGEALSIADADVVLAPVHGDREDPIDGVHSGLIASATSMPEGSTVHLAESLEDAARMAAALAAPGSTVLTVGSGTVTQAADWILAAVDRP